MSYDISPPRVFLPGVRDRRAVAFVLVGLQKRRWEDAHGVQVCIWVSLKRVCVYLVYVCVCVRVCVMYVCMCVLVEFCTRSIACLLGPGVVVVVRNCTPTVRSERQSKFGECFFGHDARSSAESCFFVTSIRGWFDLCFPHTLVNSERVHTYLVRQYRLGRCSLNGCRDLVL